MSASGHCHGTLLVMTTMAAIGAMSLPSLVAAQYVYNPANADEGPGIRYFGSAKDDKGVLLPGVSVQIANQQLSFLLVTDAEGRFRVNLPLDMRAETVTPTCFKAGFELVQISKRPGPAGPKLTVQVDCVLRASRPTASGDSGDLEHLRQTGNLAAQRRHAWAVVASLANTQNGGGAPAFESWYSEAATFATSPRAAAGIHDFARITPDRASMTVNGLAASSADIPTLTYTLYNSAAFRHIRRHRLYLRAELTRLKSQGAVDEDLAADRSVPAFPAQAIVLKTTWWPVAEHGITALPVWDPADNAPRRAGNDYTTWARSVAVDPHGRGAPPTTAVDFAGRSFAGATRVDLQAFYHVSVTARLARSLGHDAASRKLAAIALGRPIRAGDTLILVAANLATREMHDWVWAALWWHDRSDVGPFAAERPATLPSPWRNYLLDVAFDSAAPAAADGGPHVCFNPWLEGRFPDGGQGGGTASNCMACHRRASFPAIDFLPVTRGSPQLGTDPAYDSERLRTSFLWSLALHSRP